MLNFKFKCIFYTKPFFNVFSGTFPKKSDHFEVNFRERSRKQVRILRILH